MNTTMLLITVVILFFSLIVFVCILNKKNREIIDLNEELQHKDSTNIEIIKDYYGKEWDDEKKELSNKLDLEKKNYELKISEYTGDIKNLEVHLAEKEKRYNEVNQDLDLYKKGKIKEIDSATAEYEKHQQTIIKNSLDEYRNLWYDKFNEDLAKISETRNEKLEELGEIDKELEEKRAKRKAINEEILRQRALDEQQDFYRIQLPDEDKPDIAILRDIAPRLRHPDAINKIIWSNYYQKPLAELRKRLLPDGDFSGVYKITRIKDGEIYIGQTTSIDKRWQEHVKTALGCGTLASTQLHRVMAEDGPEGFTFEVLEKTPKDKLRERESYYIDFYDSKTYGLNTVTGDKNK